jgi:dipeptidase E
LDAFDLLHVGGGNTFRLLDQVHGYAFTDAVRDFVEMGGTYYGSSAGALIACENIAIAAAHDPNDVNLLDLNGLGLVARYSVLPHCDDTAVEWSQAWVREHHSPLLAIPERGGIRYDRNAFTVIGPNSSVEIDQSGRRTRSVGASWSQRTS